MSSPSFCCAKTDREAPLGHDEPSTSSSNDTFGDSSLDGLQFATVFNLGGGTTSTPQRTPNEQYYDALDNQEQNRPNVIGKDQLKLELEVVVAAKERRDTAETEFWEDIGVVEFLDRRLGTPDDSTPEQRCEDLREVLAETDIIEAHGDVSDFLFHVARTKHGKIYIRVIRTMLLNRGITLVGFKELESCARF